MVLELSRLAEADGVMQACITTKQWTLEEDAIAEALAWSYEHGDMKHVISVDRIASGHKYLDDHDESNYDNQVADEADSRIFHPALLRGFNDLPESQDAIKTGNGEVVHLLPAQRDFPSRQSSIKHGGLLSKRKWFKQLDAQALNSNVAKNGTTLVSPVPSTRSRRNRLFRDWSPIIGTELGRTGSFLSELFGRSSSDLELDDLPEMDVVDWEETGRGLSDLTLDDLPETHGEAPWLDVVDWEGAAGIRSARMEHADPSADSEITKYDTEFTFQIGIATVESPRRRQHDTSITFSF